jgi:hypothetical protein
MIYVGIDPGLTGAVCALTVEHPDAPPTGCIITPTPTEWTKVNKKPRRAYALVAMYHLLGEYPEPITRLAIERQAPRPHDGTVGAFRTGYGYAAWLAFLVARRIPYTIVEPRTWRRALGVPQVAGVVGKRAVRSAVQARLPDVHLTLDTSDAVALALVALLDRP